MPMVIKKAMTNNPLYIVKESHTFPKSFKIAL